MSSIVISPTSLHRETVGHHDPLGELANYGALVRESSAKIPSLPRPSTPRRPFGLRAALVSALVVAVGFGFAWKKLQPAAAIVAAEPTASAATMVRVASPTPVTDGEVELPATVRPWQTTELHARASGYLVAWHKELGSEVQAGELLAELETPELDQELLEAQSAAAEAAAAVVQARAERVEAEAELKVSEAQRERVRAETNLAISHLARRESLLATQAISQEEYDTFRRQVEARSADLAAADADVSRRQTSLSTKSAVIEAREATARSREAGAERVKELQRFKQIVAPFAGTITGRTAEVGMLITAGKESLFTLEDMSKVRVQVNVPQAYAVQTRAGAQVVVELPEAGGKATTAKVTRIAQSINSASRTMLAEIELPNADRSLQPGSFVQVKLATSSAHSSWTIPTNTLQMRVEGPHVALVNDRNQVELRKIQLGRDLGGRVVVLQGIRGGERLIVNPGDGLRADDVVRIADASVAAKASTDGPTASAE
ncbi:MAG: hypothetical protein C0483_07995 [Pirellula sp.]|nr:hypothetical protein [Pirellula sp.]